MASDDPNVRPAIRFRHARFDDHRQIMDLQARYRLDSEPYDDWVHLWANNPLYHELSNWPIGWVLESEESDVVGYIGNIPRMYELGGQRVVVSSSRGLVVDVQYRSYSLPLLSHFFNQKQVDLYLDTTVNPESLKSHEIFRAQRVPTGTWDKSVFWITNYKGFSASLVKRKEWQRQKGLMYPLSFGLFLRDAFAGRPLRTKCDGAEPEACSAFDSRFDVFWQKLRMRFPGKLLADRSRQVLEWHYQRVLDRGRAWVLAHSNGSGLAAYAVFFRQDNPEFGLSRMRLVDFQSLDNDGSHLRSLVCHALKRCRQTGVHMLEAIGFSPEKHRVLESMNPDHRELSSWRYFYRAPNRQLGERLKDPSVWDPCCFDGDASL